MTPTPTAPVLPALAAIALLPDEPALLKGMIAELVVTLHERERDHEALRHRLDLLLRRLYGPRGERYDPAQPVLFAEPAQATDADPAATAPAADADPPASQEGTEPQPAAEAPKRRGRPHGRRQLPKDLPRVSQHHELPEAARLCPCCGVPRIDIGTDRSDQLDYRPASLFVVRHLIHKYACPHCLSSPAPAPAPAVPTSAENPAMPEPPPQPPTRTPATADATPQPPTPAAQPSAADVPPAPSLPPVDLHPVVIAAPKPAQPIAKGLPGAGLLAHLIVSKYADHLPLYRLERIYERQGVFLPRSTLCDWLAAVAGLLRPLYALMVQLVLQSRALHTDDTPVKMQEWPSHLLTTARLWVYLGDAAHPYNVFDFTTTRQRDGPQQFLVGYQGYLHADAFSGYDCLYLPEPLLGQAGIVEVACNAHARRKFYEARSSDAVGSHQALGYYHQLYELERSAQRLDFSESQRLQMRHDLALPILKQFQEWLERQRRQALPKSPLGEAVGYALNNWSALVRYTEAGFLSIDNNAAEREMKRIAIGRKNWLFVGSPQGGQTAAVLFSFTSTCARLGVEPWAYLQDVLTRLPGLPASQLGELLPDRWQVARQAQPTAPGENPPPAASHS
jgi:transposase